LFEIPEQPERIVERRGSARDGGFRFERRQPAFDVAADCGGPGEPEVRALTGRHVSLLCGAQIGDARDGISGGAVERCCRGCRCARLPVGLPEEVRRCAHDRQEHD
jgi:hypothetical protein